VVEQRMASGAWPRSKPDARLPKLDVIRRSVDCKQSR
jgi:hypothetical protein